MIDLHQVTDYVAYWVLFWSSVNILLPPREVFKDSSPRAQKRYNTMLMLVAYYGSLNIRQLTVKMYDSVQTGQAVAPPHQLDNALLDAAVSTEKVKKESDKAADAIATAQDAVPGGK